MSRAGLLLSAFLALGGLTGSAQAKSPFTSPCENFYAPGLSPIGAVCLFIPQIHPRNRPSRSRSFFPPLLRCSVVSLHLASGADEGELGRSEALGDNTQIREEGRSAAGRKRGAIIAKSSIPLPRVVLAP